MSSSATLKCQPRTSINKNPGALKEAIRHKKKSPALRLCLTPYAVYLRAAIAFSALLTSVAPIWFFHLSYTGRWRSRRPRVLPA
jgi:hypothetical protein